MKVFTIPSICFLYMVISVGAEEVQEVSQSTPPAGQNENTSNSNQTVLQTQTVEDPSIRRYWQNPGGTNININPGGYTGLNLSPYSQSRPGLNSSNAVAIQSKIYPNNPGIYSQSSSNILPFIKQQKSNEFTQLPGQRLNPLNKGRLYSGSYSITSLQSPPVAKQDAKQLAQDTLRKEELYPLNTGILPPNSLVQQGIRKPDNIQLFSAAQMFQPGQSPQLRQYSSSVINSESINNIDSRFLVPEQLPHNLYSSDINGFDSLIKGTNQGPSHDKYSVGLYNVDTLSEGQKPQPSELYSPTNYDFHAAFQESKEQPSNQIYPSESYPPYGPQAPSLIHTITPPDEEITPCENSNVLQNILNNLLGLLLDKMYDAPKLNNINYVIDSINSQIQESPDGLQNAALYPKLRDLEQKTAAGAYNLQKRLQKRELKTKVIFKEEVPRINEPQCKAAFLKLMALAYKSYLQALELPNCKVSNTILPDNPFNPSKIILPNSQGWNDNQPGAPPGFQQNKQTVYPSNILLPQENKEWNFVQQNFSSFPNFRSNNQLNLDSKSPEFNPHPSLSEMKFDASIQQAKKLLNRLNENDGSLNFKNLEHPPISDINVNKTDQALQFYNMLSALPSQGGTFLSHLSENNQSPVSQYPQPQIPQGPSLFISPSSYAYPQFQSPYKNYQTASGNSPSWPNRDLQNFPRVPPSNELDQFVSNLPNPPIPSRQLPSYIQNTPVPSELGDLSFGNILRNQAPQLPYEFPMRSGLPSKSSLPNLPSLQITEEDSPRTVLSKIQNIPLVSSSSTNNNISLPLEGKPLNQKEPTAPLRYQPLSVSGKSDLEPLGWAPPDERFKQTGYHPSYFKPVYPPANAQDQQASYQPALPPHENPFFSPGSQPYYPSNIHQDQSTGYQPVYPSYLTDDQADPSPYFQPNSQASNQADYKPFSPPSYYSVNPTNNQQRPTSNFKPPYQPYNKQLFPPDYTLSHSTDYKPYHSDLQPNSQPSYQPDYNSGYHVTHPPKNEPGASPSFQPSSQIAYPPGYQQNPSGSQSLNSVSFGPKPFSASGFRTDLRVDKPFYPSSHEIGSLLPQSFQPGSQLVSSVGDQPLYPPDNHQPTKPQTNSQPSYQPDYNTGYHVIYPPKYQPGAPPSFQPSSQTAYPPGYQQNPSGSQSINSVSFGPKPFSASDFRTVLQVDRPFYPSSHEIGSLLPQSFQPVSQQISSVGDQPLYPPDNQLNNQQTSSFRTDIRVDKPFYPSRQVLGSLLPQSFQPGSQSISSVNDQPLYPPDNQSNNQQAYSPDLQLVNSQGLQPNNPQGLVQKSAYKLSPSSLTHNTTPLPVQQNYDSYPRELPGGVNLQFPSFRSPFSKAATWQQTPNIHTANASPASIDNKSPDTDKGQIRNNRSTPILRQGPWLSDINNPYIKKIYSTDPNMNQNSLLQQPSNVYSNQQIEQPIPYSQQQITSPNSNQGIVSTDKKAGNCLLNCLSGSGLTQLPGGGDIGLIAILFKNPTQAPLTTIPKITQQNVINIYLLPQYKGLTPSQKINLLEFLQQSGMMAPKTEVSQQNQQLLKVILLYLKQILVQNATSASTHNTMSPDILNNIYELLYRLVNNPEQTKTILVQLHVYLEQAKQQGVDYKTFQNINQLNAYIQNVLAKLTQMKAQPSPNVMSVPTYKYLLQLISDMVPNPQQRQTVVDQLNLYIKWAAENQVDLNQKENLQKLGTFVQDVIRKLVNPLQPIDTTPQLPPPPPSVIPLTTPPPINYYRWPEILSTPSTLDNVDPRPTTPQYLIAPVSLPSLSPGPIPSYPSKPVLDATILTQIYQQIDNVVTNPEHKQFVTMYIQSYLKWAASAGIDLNIPTHLNQFIVFVRSVLVKVLSLQKATPDLLYPKPSINAAILSYLYQLINSLVVNAEQRQIVIVQLHSYINMFIQKGLDLNVKENLNQLVAMVVALVKSIVTVATTAPVFSPDLNILPVKPNVIELVYQFEQKILITGLDDPNLPKNPGSYIKYRVPYNTFTENLKDLLLRKPNLRINPEHLSEELSSTTNITEVSPELQGVPKKELIQLITHNGSFIDAKIPDDDIDKNLRSAADLESVAMFEKIIHELDYIINNITNEDPKEVKETNIELVKENENIVQHDSISGYDPIGYNANNPFYNIIQSKLSDGSVEPVQLNGLPDSQNQELDNGT